MPAAPALDANNEAVPLTSELVIDPELSIHSLMAPTLGMIPDIRAKRSVVPPLGTMMLIPSNPGGGATPAFPLTTPRTK